MTISINKTFNNKFPDGKEYKTHSIKIEEPYGTIYFNVEELPSKEGGTYFKFPQTIWDKELFKSSDFKKGFTNHILPDRAFLNTLRELISKEVVNEEPTTLNESINVDEIEF